MFQTTSQLSFIASQQLHTWRGVAGSPRCPLSPDPDCGAAAISSSAPFAAQQHLLRVGVVPKASFGQGKRGQLRGSRPWRLEEHIYVTWGIPRRWQLYMFTYKQKCLIY